MSQHLGIIGMGVMGGNLALNLERNGFAVALFDLYHEKTLLFCHAHPGLRLHPYSILHDFVHSLERPRKVLMMVNAGAAVDAVIQEIRPLLQTGDILIDGGNSFYPDTERRFDALSDSGIRYIGMGVSGGEEGALWGPSLMPGGDRSAFQELEPILTRISAQTESGACAAYIGERSAGHFVKMCHNGIEYGDMQLIAETYDLLRHVFQLPPKEIAAVFQAWNESELQSYLIEITADIVCFPDDLNADGVLIDAILDTAGQKGTGKWVAQTALDLGIPIPTISASVDARFMSALKSERVKAAALYPSPAAKNNLDVKDAIPLLKDALYASKICSYSQGFALMQAASKAFNYNLQMNEIARIWKGGCIIRALFLDRIRAAFDSAPDLPNLLTASHFQPDLSQRTAAWRNVVSMAAQEGIAVPAMSASLAYFDAYRRECNPANVIQAQRDYFGAHTYQRIDRDGVFHTQWTTSS